MEIVPIILGAVIAIVQTLMLFILQGIREQVADLWRGIAANAAIAHDIDKRVAVIESRSHDSRHQDLHH